MIDDILSLIAPHYCFGCTKVGVVLCQNCKYNIISEPYRRCINCAVPITTNRGVCLRCKLPYSRAWCIGERNGELESLLNAYKFSNVRAVYKAFADLLDSSLSNLPSSVYVVPVPTITTHIRQRGYDHTALIAKEFARKRKLTYLPCLGRKTNTVQRGKGRGERIKQAKTAFTCQAQLDDSGVYLLIDDVVTTGATVRYSAKALKAAGAKDVWVASISRQPLD
ncbi:MAG: putative Phosphoribosyltransferase [Candidatus Saccharibacteria bacterium GW2011_GWC2_44_17]|nr:MAG: putative Phosphoribosyltransferase [Candidatus Saccharibacteria bacterium GW2011_GWC2_44_17]